MIDEKIHVAIKSFKRAGMVTTLEVAPFAHVWVPEYQEDEYREHYGDRVITIPDKSDGNLCRKSNAILDRSPCEWTLILDDDITQISYFERTQKHVLRPPELKQMIIDCFQVASECGVRLWGVNQNDDPMAYRICTPFSMLSPVLGPFNGHLNPELRYDESVLGKDDYDFWLQNIQKYHRTLRFNKYHYLHDHGKKAGGFVSMRTRERELKGGERMIQKWGPKVYRIGGSENPKSNRRVNPNGNILNSLVKVPIKGI